MTIDESEDEFILFRMRYYAGRMGSRRRVAPGHAQPPEEEGDGMMTEGEDMLMTESSDNLVIE